MQIVVLAAFIITLSLTRGVSDQPPVLSPPQMFLAVALYLLLAGVLAALASLPPLKVLKARSQLPQRQPKWRAATAVLANAWLVGGLAGLIYLGWGYWVNTALRLGAVPLAGTLTVMLPFFLALVIVWVLQYPQFLLLRQRLIISRAQAGLPSPRPWSLGQYLDHHLRQHLLFIGVPISLIVLVEDLAVLFLAPWLEANLSDAAAEIVLVAVVVGCAGMIFLLAPVLIIHIWRTSPMPAGPLRDRLEQLSRTLGLRHRELRIWHSGGVIANAGVMGLIGPVRYVLLSDGLLEQMSDDEVQGVFAHEAGHILNHHIFYSALFALGTVTLVSAVAGALAQTGLPDITLNLVMLSLLALAWAFGFGWVSRRFERQCDVAAAWVCGYQGRPDSDRITHEGAAVFAKALESVAALNGMSARKFNWRHGSIASRVSHVIWVGSTGGSRVDSDRQVAHIKRGLWVLVAAGLGLQLAVAWLWW
jgi:STE24 endopeptidase